MTGLLKSCSSWVNPSYRDFRISARFSTDGTASRLASRTSTGIGTCEAFESGFGIVYLLDDFTSFLLGLLCPRSIENQKA